jgi:phytoene/squalene synthetase
VDDTLDDDLVHPGERTGFLARQQSLLTGLYAGQLVGDLTPQEAMLADLVTSDPDKNSGLHVYLHDMMAVMAFDASRRGRLITQEELSGYTRWLACAVTEAMHYFIGHCDASPRDASRYQAVSGAHVAHMLRDTYADLQAGYYNIPMEVLEAGKFTPRDIHSPGYRDWVWSRVRLARQYFRMGRDYLSRVTNPRCRLAGFAYLARFEWLLDTMEQEEYHLRPAYNERRAWEKSLRMIQAALVSVLHMPSGQPATRNTGSPQVGMHP